MTQTMAAEQQSPAVIPGAVMDRHMHGQHVNRPAFPERIAWHPAAVEALQRAHEPHLILVEDRRRITRKRHPTGLILRHNVSLRHLTSRDVSYRFRR